MHCSGGVDTLGCPSRQGSCVRCAGTCLLEGSSTVHVPSTGVSIGEDTRKCRLLSPELGPPSAGGAVAEEPVVLKIPTGALARRLSWLELPKHQKAAGSNPS